MSDSRKLECYSNMAPHVEHSINSTYVVANLA